MTSRTVEKKIKIDQFMDFYVDICYLEEEADGQALSVVH